MNPRHIVQGDVVVMPVIQLSDADSPERVVADLRRDHNRGFATSDHGPNVRLRQYRSIAQLTGTTCDHLEQRALWIGRDRVGVRMEVDLEGVAKRHRAGFGTLFADAHPQAPVLHIKVDVARATGLPTVVARYTDRYNLITDRGSSCALLFWALIPETPFRRGSSLP